MLFETKPRTLTDQLVVCPTNTLPDAVVDLEHLDRQHRQMGYIAVRFHFLITRDGTVEHGRGVETHGNVSQYQNDNSIFIALAGGLCVDCASDALGSVVQSR